MSVAARTVAHLEPAIPPAPALALLSIAVPYVTVLRLWPAPLGKPKRAGLGLTPAGPPITLRCLAGKPGRRDEPPPAPTGASSFPRSGRVLAAASRSSRTQTRLSPSGVTIDRARIIRFSSGTFRPALAHRLPRRPTTRQSRQPRCRMLDRRSTGDGQSRCGSVPVRGSRPVYRVATYVINLDRSPERLAAMAGQLEALRHAVHAHAGRRRAPLGRPNIGSTPASIGADTAARCARARSAAI